jgi:hypothetical protein
VATWSNETVSRIENRQSSLLRRGFDLGETVGRSWYRERLPSWSVSDALFGPIPVAIDG